MTGLDPWEARWAPYDEATYQSTLNQVRAGDVVLDIGAGDLRLSRRMAQIARQVFAIEIQPELVKINDLPLPDNLILICGDARYVPWPTGISVAVLLMRHCRHLSLYVARLRAQGCSRLVTNARWGMDVELVNLDQSQAWHTVAGGWYACCSCGETGFVPVSPEQLTIKQMERVAQVESCPACAPHLSSI